MRYPTYTERATALVTATLAVHMADPDDHDAWLDATAARDRVYDDELSDDGTVDPVLLKVAMNMFAATLKVLAQETGQDPVAMWRNVAIHHAAESS